MLDAHIIEQIKRRERDRQRDDRQRPSLEIPRRDDTPHRSEREERPVPGPVVHVDL